jgi:hypothetical protein
MAKKKTILAFDDGYIILEHAEYYISRKKTSKESWREIAYGYRQLKATEKLIKNSKPEQYIIVCSPHLVFII